MIKHVRLLSSLSSQSRLFFLFISFCFHWGISMCLMDFLALSLLSQITNDIPRRTFFFLSSLILSIYNHPTIITWLLSWCLLLLLRLLVITSSSATSWLLSESIFTLICYCMFKSLLKLIWFPLYPGIYFSHPILLHKMVLLHSNLSFWLFQMQHSSSWYFKDQKSNLNWN